MLKSFDFFRKIQTDQQLTSATGGVFTLVALVVLPHPSRSQDSSSSTPSRTFTLNSTTPSWQSRTTTPKPSP